MVIGSFSFGSRVAESTEMWQTISDNQVKIPNLNDIIIKNNYDI
jgi:hypothetical protein